MPTPVVLRDPARFVAHDDDVHDDGVLECTPARLSRGGNPSCRPVRAGVQTSESRSSPGGESLRSCRSDCTSRSDGSGRHRRRRTSILTEERIAYHLSSSDISASPRLVGYLFSFTASMVLMLSAVEFKTVGVLDDIETFLEDNDIHPGDNYFPTPTFPVLKYKTYAAIAWGAAGAGISIFIVALHFDRWCLPQVWKATFRDGSRGEQTLLMCLILFWILGVHFCTSLYSVGMVNVNVYFSCWLAFIAILLNYDIWRDGADKPSVSTVLQNHRRSTTHHWFWTFILSLMALLSTTDIYVESRIYRPSGAFEDMISVSTSDWVLAFSVSGASVVASAIALILNTFISADNPPTIRGFRRREGKCVAVRVDIWRQTEGVLLVCMIFVWSWMILRYTDVGGVVSQPSNPYFSIWGTFLMSIMTFGDWLKEQRRELKRRSAV